MKLNKKMAKVVADLEYEIGSECYNPSSYDGWHYIEGCDFRYPVNFLDENDEYTKIRDNVNDSILSGNVNAKTVPLMKYKFGANELMIGRGIINVLNYLEDRYDISFNDLEKNAKKKPIGFN